MMFYFDTSILAPLILEEATSAEAIYSLDKTLLKAGKCLGLPVSTGIGPVG